MSKSGQAAYDAQEQERGVDNYLAEEGERRHDIEQRITALEIDIETMIEDVVKEKSFGNIAANDDLLSTLKKSGIELTEALREKDYPKQPEPVNLDGEDIPF